MKTSSKMSRIATYIIIGCALLVMVGELIIKDWVTAVWAFNAALWAFVSIQADDVIDILNDQLADAMDEISELLEKNSQLKKELEEEKEKNSKK